VVVELRDEGRPIVAAGFLLDRYPKEYSVIGFDVRLTRSNEKVLPWVAASL